MSFLKTLSIVFFFLLLTASGCRRKNLAPIDKLPPETQTGANTFGCLVNGEAFLPKGDPFGGPIKKAQYQFLNGKQGFGISAKRSGSDMVKDVAISGDSFKLAAGIYDLTEHNRNGRLSGSYAEYKLATVTVDDYYTNNIQRGQLIITKFDTMEQIVSGTFWFDAKNAAGQIVQVRSGRFDLGYVR